jgi:HlyD family secretion protein
VDQGDELKDGQVVAQLDDQDLQHEVEVEEANVTARRAGIERLEADITFSKATLEYATANHKRMQSLRSSGGVSQEEVDKAIEALAVARAGVARAEAALSEGKKQLIATEKARDVRVARLADAVIRAPFAGVVVRRERNVGDVVVPGSSILTIVATDELWVEAWVDETQSATVKPGQPARVVFRSDPAVEYTGAVVRLGRDTDRETREMRVDIATEHRPANWSVGQRAETYIETARVRADVVVPLRFLTWQDDRAGVFIDASGRAAWRAVTLGVRGRDLVEVKEGLTRGDVVLTPVGLGGAKLNDGTRVQTP